MKSKLLNLITFITLLCITVGAHASNVIVAHLLPEGVESDVYNILVQTHGIPIKKALGKDAVVLVTTGAKYNENNGNCLLHVTSMIGAGSSERVTMNSSMMPYAMHSYTQVVESPGRCGELYGILLKENGNVLTRNINSLIKGRM